MVDDSEGHVVGVVIYNKPLFTLALNRFTEESYSNR